MIFKPKWCEACRIAISQKKWLRHIRKSYHKRMSRRIK